MAAAPLGQLQHALSSSSQRVGNLDVKEKMKDIYFSLKDVCPFPAASRALCLCAHQHIPGGASPVNGFPLAKQGGNTGKQPKETKAYPISYLSIILDGWWCPWPEGEAGRCNYWLLFAGL